MQEEGELVLIPPRWWHQVYHLDSSVCLAWQYADSANLQQVLQHILDWSAGGEGPGPAPPAPVDAPYRERIEKALELAMIVRHGAVEGARMYRKLIGAEG